MTKLDPSIVVTTVESKVAHYENLHNPRRDEIDIMSEFYPEFGIMFTEDEVDRIHTVGDLYEALFARLNEIGHGEKCRYAMIFFRLRSFFKSKFNGVSFTPDTKVSALATSDVQSLLMDLGKQTGLNAPFASYKYGKRISALLLVGIASLLIGLAVSYLAALFGLGCIFASIFALMPSHLGWENPDMTIREMVIKIEPLNYHFLTKGGGRHDRPTLWNALTNVLGFISDLDPKRISHTTRLLRSD